MKTLRVGVLGTGDVGRALGRGLVGLGHEVKMGARDAKSPKAVEWARETGRGASAGSSADAVEFGELIVLATLGQGTENAIQLAGPQNFRGKVVLDATNPLIFEEGKLPALFVGHSDSLGERVQRLVPEARVVKAFNTVGNAFMVHPKFPEGRPDMFICGNDPGAKALVTEICTAWGWGTVDVGSIECARLLEPMCLVWVYYGIQTATWSHAFKLLRK